MTIDAHMLPRKASVTIIVRSICCSKIKGKVDDFTDEVESDKDEAESKDDTK